MRGIRLPRLLLLIAVVVSLPVVLDAQRRAIRGRLEDATGAAIAGASIALLLDGQPEQTTTTAPDGTFRFPLIDFARGPRELRVTIGGKTSTIALTAEGQQVTSIDGVRVVVQATSPATAAAKAPAPLPPPPPPAPVPPLPTTVPGPVPPVTNPDVDAVVPVFYATDRSRVSYTPLAYSGDREASRQLHLGRIDVSVPRDHQMGQLERPDVWTFWREDPGRHFVIVKAAEQTYDAFYHDVASVVGRSRRKEAFVFVHGFNVSFESAVYRTAQIAYDMQFDGAPILYSWPSLAKPTGYPTDANNSDWTIDRLHWFLEDVSAKSGAQVIHVIAHSRGNWPLMSALNAIAVEPNHGMHARFSQIVLTAPDVDADTFKVLARTFHLISERTTLYASANDEALALSKQYQGYQRAGDVRPQIVSMDHLDSIDVSAVDTSLLGHSYFGDNTSVISDIRRLLQTGYPPERRCGIQAVADAVVRYWTFVAHTVCPA